MKKQNAQNTKRGDLVNDTLHYILHTREGQAAAKQAHAAYHAMKQAVEQGLI